MSSKPTEQVKPHNDESGVADDPTDQVSLEPGLTAGVVLDHGRYRLLSQVGSDVRCAAQLWRAKDGVLGRDVALTILVGDRSDSGAASNARRTLERAMHASTFNHVGVARVLDVVTQSPGDPPGVLGMVIAEWTHGTDLADLVAEGPVPPGTAARLLQPLAGAVESAHHAGLVLGADHPQRIRVTPEGEVRMAFPGPLAKATSSEDVRGLGAALYLLLTGRWALDGGPEGLPSAPTGPDGTVVAPRTLRPTVPLELSTVAARALGSPDQTGTTGGVRTGAAVLRVLEQHATYESSTDVMQSVQSGPDTREQEVWSTDDPKPDPIKRRKLLIGVGVLAAATLIVVGTITANLIGIFAGTEQSTGPSKTLGEQETHQQPTPAQAAPVQVASGTAVSAGQSPDNPGKVSQMFDGDASSSWNTADYNDQLGSGFASGTGAMLNLASPTTVSQVTVDSPSAGSKVEIRAADDAQTNPQQAPVVGQADLTAGQTTIPVQAGKPTQHLVVWLTKLGSNGGKFSTRINEVTVAGSAG